MHGVLSQRIYGDKLCGYLVFIPTIDNYNYIPYESYYSVFISTRVTSNQSSINLVDIFVN